MNSEKDIKILNIGCGNGRIQDELYEDGYHHITNNDISPVVISQMNEVKVEREYEGMCFEVMDATCMKYEDETFDLVLDKSTLDALLCSETPFVQAAQMLGEVERVLKTGGVYLMISYSEPKYRLNHLQREHVNFRIKIEVLKRWSEEGYEVVHYAYICRKERPREARQGAWWARFYDKLREEESNE